MYSLLPPIDKNQYLELPHFPSRFHAAVFRFWETVPARRIAAALKATEADVCQAAEAMGLPEQNYSALWQQRGYITIIRSAWHLLPYDQILTLLGWTEQQLANALKDEDFLYVKLGFTKPFCPPITKEPLTEQGEKQLQQIKALVQKNFSGLFDGAKPFDFFSNNMIPDGQGSHNDNIRMIFSYCGLYANVLDEDISLSYPDALLQLYQASGINTVWLPATLYQLVPFPFDPAYSQGWQQRQQRLRELIAKAASYGLQVFLYINEPRCMPLAFFEQHPHLKGAVWDQYGALCTSRPEVMEYLDNGIRQLCTDVSGLGGFFVITCSENLTHCKSRSEATECPNCKDRSTGQLVNQVLNCIYSAATSVDPSIRIIAWDWAWDSYMTREEMTECIASLPKDIIIQCSSESRQCFTRGGVKGEVRDYSISVPGPSERTLGIWQLAKDAGHACCAKVQVNVSWECSTLPFLPVFDLLREHMQNLQQAGVEHLMLSWTLGGWPSVNLKVATACYDDPDPEKYRALLRQEYGSFAPQAEKAATAFSNAFREFPFHIDNLYFGPQNGGPSNLLFPEPSGFPATMTCFAFDELDKWRAIYPQDIYIDQLRKLSEMWAEGLNIIQDMPECDFTLAAQGGYALFRSSYLQARFIAARQEQDGATMADIAAEEAKLALMMYELMQKSALFGYEAANHYYFTKSMLAEKVLNCERVQNQI